MNTTSRDLPYAISQAIRIEEHPPFFFIVLWFWRQISETVLWGRTLSALCTVGFLVIAWRVAARMLPKIHPAWIIAPIAMNPSLIYAATEMRPPAMTLLVSGLLMWLFIEGFLIESPKRWAALAYGVMSVIALYTYYYLGFLLLANGVALLLTRRPRQIVQYYATMALAAVTYAPMILALPEQANAFTSRQQFALTFFGGFRLMVERIQSFLWPSIGLPLPGKTRWIVPGLLAAGVLTTLYTRRREIGKPLVLFLTITAVAATSLSLVAWQLGWRSMLERHTMLMVLPAYLCLYGTIGLYADVPRRRVLAAWTTLVALTSAVGFHELFHPLAKSGDWRRVAEFIEAKEQLEEPILVFPSMSANAFTYHYRGRNSIVPIPRPESFVRYNRKDDALKDESEIAATIEQIPHAVESAWVIVNCNPEDCSYMGVDHNLEALERFVASRYTVDESRDFYGVYVKHCTMSDQLAASK
jgi:hypothetical protein